VRRGSGRDDLDASLAGDEDDDDLNIIGDDDEAEETFDLFVEGQPCDVCGSEEGRVGLDPTGRGAYDGEPRLFGYNCLADGLRAAWAAIEGVSTVIEPFGEYSALYYYRVDELPAYQFVREDIEAVSWLLLTVGDNCSRCTEQSRHAWLTQDFVDPRLPENRPLFRNLDADIEHLCNGHAAERMARACREIELPLMTIELPRSAMGLLMPTGD
jgi:hypothetical protein